MAPAIFADDRERLARLEREAQLLAALNHPNIAALHGLEEFDGLRFLGLEYVPGETLRGPLAPDEALPVVHQFRPRRALARLSSIRYNERSEAVSNAHPSEPDYSTRGAGGSVSLSRRRHKKQSKKSNPACLDLRPTL